MTIAVQYGVPALLWAIAIWRLPSVAGTAQQRALWATFTSLALSLTTGIPLVVHALGVLTGMPNFASVLLVHLFGVVSFSFLLDFIAASYQAEGGGAPGVRFWRPVAAVYAVAMTVVYFVAGLAQVEWPHGESKNLTGTLLFLLAFYCCLATVMATSTWLFGKRALLPSPRLVRSGLSLLACGCGLGSAYALLRTADVCMLLHSKQLSNPGLAVAGNALMGVAIVLIIVGSCLPPISTGLRSIRAAWVLHRVRDLWSDVTQAVPHVVAVKTPNRLLSQIREGNLPYQARRRVVEIRDAALVLGSYAPPGLADEVRALAAKGESVSAGTELQAEALWLRSVLELHQAGAPAQDAPGLFTVTGDARDDLKRLLGLARAYRWAVQSPLPLPGGVQGGAA